VELTWDSTDCYPAETKYSPTAVAVDRRGNGRVTKLARYRGGSWISA
jgi:hypothetical protein